MGYWKSERGIIGDEPADAIGDAIDKIKSHYKRDLDREPTVDEIKDVFNFVIKPLEK